MSETLTIRVNKEIKCEMSNFRVNWSEFLRESIRKKLLDLKRENAIKNMDKLRVKTKGENINLADEVVKWRREH